MEAIKKGVVFTFIVVILLFIIMIAFLINLKSNTNNLQLNQVKVDNANSFVRILNSSLIPEVIRTSANQAMFALLDYEFNNKIYVNNVEDYFKQVMNNGKYNGVQQNFMFDNNLDYTLNKTLYEITKLSLENGFTFNYSKADITNIKLTQEDPWNVKVSLNFSYQLIDLKNDTIWNINNNKIYAFLNIENYTDPIYLVNLSKKVKIKKAFYNFSSIENFDIHVNNSYFIHNPNAPIFLQRLNGDYRTNFSITGNGIESILNTTLENTFNSSIDYLYFKGISGDCIVGIPNTTLLYNSGNPNYFTTYNRTKRECN